MPAKQKNYLPAIACALAPIFSYFVVRPYAEIGIDDDWGYIKTAQVLAQTGHLVYNGWEAAMLGWQAYFGALLIKLFGFSFTAVRFSTVMEAMVTAFLLQRVCIRAGLNSWNATLVTFTFVLSPVFLPLSFTFMSDVPGVFVIIVCLHMCLRAVQAENERSAMIWICLAALANAVGGTARQIAWLGVLVMVPSTLWLLRRSRRVLLAGCISWIVAAGIVAAAIHWFAHQPYILPQALLPARVGLREVASAARIGLRYAGDLALLALPVLLMFAPSLRSWNRRMAAVFAAGLLCFAVPGVALIHAGKLQMWVAPFLGDYMTTSTLARLNVLTAHGTHLPVSSDVLQILLTGAVVLGIVLLVTSFFASATGPVAIQEDSGISWQNLGILLGPFSLAYIALLTSMVLQNQVFAFFNRYLLPLAIILVLVLARYYQQRVHAHLPVFCAFLVGIFAVFGIVATHDMFALYRGYVSAIDQVLSSGVPATAIEGPWEFETWTETEALGYANDPRIRTPSGAYVPQPAHAYPSDCKPEWILPWVPALKPAYRLSLDRSECGGQLAFPPTMYRTWVGPHTNWIYTIRLPSPLPG